jgi:DNA ligase (NAD+)
MNKIQQFLDEASRRYYNGDPIISDELFDQLADSIDYANIGAKQHEDVEKHFYPMYSLQKFYEDEEKKNPLQGYTDIKYSLKLDGAAISILYIDGKLSRVLTRGDGIEGRTITDKFLETNIIPHNIKAEGIIQITGEIVSPKHIENARNYAAGSLSLKDINDFRTRAVSFYAYGVQGNFFDTYEEDMKQLRRLGFNTVYGEYELDKIYPCDGLVYRLNDNKLFNELGYTAKHPRGAYAKKERSQGAETTLLDVLWQVGKSGKVTPVAILEPIMLGDAQVSRATLNNPGFIEMLDLQIGDRVHVIRSGEIIPCITHKVE